MATFAGQLENNQIIFTVWISSADQAGGDTRHHSFKALLDTGAQVTAIYDKVVRTAGLQALGHWHVGLANGETVKASRFKVRIDIPIQSDLASPERAVRGREMNVAQLPYQPNNHDVLLGMDFISAFHVTMFNGEYILSN